MRRHNHNASRQFRIAASSASLAPSSAPARRNQKRNAENDLILTNRRPPRRAKNAPASARTRPAPRAPQTTSTPQPYAGGVTPRSPALARSAYAGNAARQGLPTPKELHHRRPSAPIHFAGHSAQPQPLHFSAVLVQSAYVGGKHGKATRAKTTTKAWPDARIRPEASGSASKRQEDSQGLQDQIRARERCGRG